MCESGYNYIPINEAILLLDTTVDGIMMLIDRNEIHGKNFDGTWHVDQSSLNAYAKHIATIKHEGCGTCGSLCGNGC